METQKLSPTLVYVLAILGLLCCCVGGLGFIPAGIAFFLANTKLKEASMTPENFDPSSVKAMNTAKTLALVIVGINVLYLAYNIYIISTVGWDQILEQSRMMMEQWENK